MTGIDIVAVGTLVVWAATAWWLTRRWVEGRATAEQFVVAGRRVPLGIGAASLLAAWTWSFTITTPAQNGYDFGIAGPIYYSIGGGLMLIVFTPIVSRIRRLAPDGRTLPDFIARRHGEAGRYVISALNMLSAGVLLFLNLNVVGLLFERFTSIGYQTGVALTCCLVLAYVLLSGMATSILTDCAQYVLISVAALLIVPALIINSDGVALLARASAGWGEKASLLSPTAFLKLGLPFLLMSWFSAFAYPSLWQYAWALKGDDARRAYLRAGLGWIPYGFAFGTLGVLGLAMGLQTEASSGIAFDTMARGLGVGWTGLFAALVLSAAASSCDGSISAFGALFMTDVYRAHLAPDATDPQTVRAGRVAMCLFALGMGALAMLKVNFMQAVFFLGAAKGAMLAPLLLTLWWRRLTPAGFVAGVGGGMVLGATLFVGLRKAGVEHYEVISIPVSAALGAGLAIAVSLASRKSAADTAVEEQFGVAKVREA